MHKMQKLELQKYSALIQRVCDLEHESLIRCHSLEEEALQERADNLNLIMLISLREFHWELSEAFYEFQVVAEEPEKLLEMEHHYLTIFAGMMDLYRDILQVEFPEAFDDFYERIQVLVNVSVNNPLNLN